MAASSLRRLSLRGRHLLLLDLLAFAASFVLSFVLRFEVPSAQFDSYFGAYAWLLPVLLCIRTVAFLWLKLYQRVWRYASVDELNSVVAAAGASSAVAYSGLFAAIAAWPAAFPLGGSFPRSVPIIDTILVITLAGAWRFALRMVGVGRASAHAMDGAKRALIVGGGSAGQSLIRELRSSPSIGFAPVGLLADDVARDQRLFGVPVLGGTEELGEAIASTSPEAVLFAMPSASGRVLRRLVRKAEEAGVRCLTMPSVAEVLAGRVTINALRDVEVEDLLRRAPARIDLNSVSTAFHDRTLLITGAGGSIGGELARQLARLRPRRLILVGHGENSIYETMSSLALVRDVEVVPAIVDIRERRRVDALIGESRPDAIFHAAAHKHVPLMELFPQEAVETNVLGTLNLLDAAACHGVESFVFISSDKAVNPTSVMGATKRLAELLVLEAAKASGRKYVTVRFGNVLSSRGSVVPLFRRQLAAGGPLTVTHPEATRFFMTIPEAVQLVLQASVLARPGDMFVLDMGDPVKIVDLAADLVELHGLHLGDDVEIEFVGLRPGEKLTEELLFEYERTETTHHEAIRRIVQTDGRSSLPSTSVAELATLASAGRREELLQRLHELVPEFRPISLDARRLLS